jgi:hypothetical protein
MSREEQNKFVANEIYKQLGGNHFAAMVGAKSYIHEEDGMFGLLVRFKGSRKANYVKILLNGKDLYNVIFYRAGKQLKTVAQFDDVYFDELIDTFELTTGLYTNLGWV